MEYSLLIYGPAYMINKGFNISDHVLSNLNTASKVRYSTLLKNFSKEHEEILLIMKNL